MIQLRVGADDRTGALEAAGACADAGAGPVRVVAALDEAGAGIVVVDLATRHLDGRGASQRAAALEAGWPHTVSGHKIDSTLRGNWADELVSRHPVAGRRILVMPALPAVGRTCVCGVVLEHGHPVGDGPAGGDARTPVRSSRPADHLRRAGAPDVIELAGADQVTAWLAATDGSPFAVGDARSDAELVAVAARWAGRSDVVLGGTAATIGAAAAALLGGRRRRVLPPPLVSPVLVVTGSLHPAARRQVAHLRAAGVVVVELGEDIALAIAALRARGVAVLTSPLPQRALVAEADARRTAVALAAATTRIAQAVPIATMVVLGGDTAAEVLGPEPVVVGGTVAPGTPWGRRADGDGPLFITRAGGFGDAGALSALVSGRLER